MENMSFQVEKHNQSLAGLQVEIEQLNEAVETRTSEAREKLSEYRELKHRAAAALQEVATGFQNAQALYGMGDKLMEKLKAVKVKHDALCKEAMSQARAEPEKMQTVIEQLKDARAQLHKLYDEIENIRKENIPADCEDSLV